MSSDSKGPIESDSMFAFAELWDAWKDVEGHWLQSFSIVTTSANELTASVHTFVVSLCRVERQD